MALSGAALADPWWRESFQLPHPPTQQQAAAEDAAQDRENEGGETLWQRTISDPLALYTGMLTIFTGILGVSTILLWVETRQSVRLAREEFVASHRPRIVVREVHEPTTYGPSMFTISFTLANVGESRGTVIDCDVFGEFAYTPTFLDVPRPRREPRIDPFPDVPSIPLAAGESITMGFPFHDVMTDDDRIQKSSDPRGLPFFVGRIVYVDDNQVRRNTVFRRRYNPATRRFRAWDDPELEYAD
ncbi:hypothetical protein LB543_09370 [Mesorhizobium sp. ESP7-2]|uniref:hypothetical protein n=1 Tax=Mesorhizobium sp. ESP7-2 TaxID=2876622 RepID=UPI001CCDD2C6|nr:hypothetical protein [Mesorhizobium sp. ESP7-2]MBZ9706928.1 hypothetical protein [Mesorhizobium sp. ESP7-2]